MDRRAAWGRVVAAWRESGASAAAFARQHGLRLKALFKWRDKFKTPGVQPPQPCFLELHQPAAEADCALELRRGDLRVMVHNRCDTQLLRTLITALQEQSC